MNKKQFFKYFIAFAIIGNFLACKPEEADKMDIGGLPTASFTVTATSNANRFVLTNTSTGAFLQKWDLGDGTTADTSVVTANYSRKGTMRYLV